MLAQIQAIPDVTRACVDVTGRTFVVESSNPGRRVHIIEEVVAVLGPGSSRLDEPWCWLESEGIERDLWFDTGSIEKLSYVEARLLAADWGRSVAVESGLDPETVDRLIVALRSELAREFEKVHGNGGAHERDWYSSSFPEACRRAVRFVVQESALAQPGAVLEKLLAAAGK